MFLLASFAILALAARWLSAPVEIQLPNIKTWQVPIGRAP